MSKRIGILGGISHESTIRYYKYILRKYYARKRDYHYPEVVIFSLDFQKTTGFEEKDDIDGYIGYLLEGIQRLEKSGADFVVIAANSPHSVFDVLDSQTNVPLISIVDVAAREAMRLKLKRLLLTGIKFTMQSPFYPDIFQRYGMEVITPELEQQEEIDRFIFKQLVVGIFEPATRQRLLDIIQAYEVDGVILGCTELSLILNQEDSRIPLLNTLELHAGAALDFALED